VNIQLKFAGQVSKSVSKYIPCCSNGLNSHDSAKSCHVGWTKQYCLSVHWNC